MNKVLLIIVALFSFNVKSAELNIGNEIITTRSEVQTQKCNDFEIYMISEGFPREYEEFLVRERGLNPYSIEGFDGSPWLTSRRLIIQPGNNQIPNANEIPEINELLVPNSTYIPSKFFCENETLAILYWKGGNCPSCEVFVEFEYEEGEFINFRIGDYSEYN